MRAIVSITLITLLCGISLAPINAIRRCASRKKNVENFSLKQNLAGVLEATSNDHNVGCAIVNYNKLVLLFKKKYIYFRIIKSLIDERAIIL